MEGRPLSEEIPPQGLPLETAVRYGAQIAAALAHAHERGVFHGGLTTSTVWVTGEGRVKVLDFGSTSDAVRADLRSLGMILYAMVRGESPAPRLPAGLRSIIERCLAERPADGFLSAAEAQAALESASALPRVLPPRYWIILLVAGLALVLVAFLIKHPWTETAP